MPDDRLKELQQKIANELAHTITTDLFSNENGDIAEKLVLKLADKKDGGSWSQNAATTHIAIIIQQKIESLQPHNIEAGGFHWMALAPQPKIANFTRFALPLIRKKTGNPHQTNHHTTNPDAASP